GRARARRGSGDVRGREPGRAWARARGDRSSKGRGSKRVGLAVPASVSPADYCPNAGSPSAGDLSVAGERGGWRLARLWTATTAVLSACHQPRRQGSTRSKAGRSADRATI